MTTTAPRAATVGTRESPPVEPSAPRSPSPMQIELRDDEPTTQQLRKPYWVGVTQDCPMESVTAGPISFERAIGKRVDEQGRPVAPEKFGRIVWVSDAEIALAIERLQSKVVRLDRPDPRIYSRKQRGFSGGVGHVPLACFVYIVPGDDDVHTVKLRASTPRALAPYPEAAKPYVQRHLAARDRRHGVETVEGADDADVHIRQDWSHIVQ